MSRYIKRVSIIVVSVATLLCGNATSHANPFVKDPLSHELERQLRLQLQARAAILNDEQLIKTKAEYMRKLFLALKAQGFNEKQALALVQASLHQDRL